MFDCPLQGQEGLGEAELPLFFFFFYWIGVSLLRKYKTKINLVIIFS